MPNRSLVTACAIPSTSIHSQSTLPWLHSSGDVRLGTGIAAQPSVLTFGWSSDIPLWARRVSPQTSIFLLYCATSRFTLSNLMAPVSS